MSPRVNPPFYDAGRSSTTSCIRVAAPVRSHIIYANEIMLVVKGEIHCLRGASLVSVMQAADLWKFYHFSTLRGLNESLIRRILRE